VQGLSSYLDQVMAGAGLTFELTHDLDTEPPPETAITVFRICQEALTNVRKHARASVVKVSLTSVDQGVRVRVTDDGVGFDQPADSQVKHGHFGLIEMRQRAEVAGGWWSIRSEPGSGATVEFWVPAVPPREVP
jgi:signal transduction histidine kinase